MPKIGDLAPDFEAPTHKGTPLKLSSLRGSRVVLYFYPKADTPGCTMESKGFRDIYSELKAHKVEVVGVSVDSVDDQSAFCSKYQLPFPLVADTSRAVSNAYGVLNDAGRDRRVTFLLDPQGKIVEVVDDRNAETHLNRTRALFLPS